LTDRELVCRWITDTRTWQRNDWSNRKSTSCQNAVYATGSTSNTTTRREVNARGNVTVMASWRDSSTRASTDLYTTCLRVGGRPR